MRGLRFGTALAVAAAFLIGVGVMAVVAGSDDDTVDPPAAAAAARPAEPVTAVEQAPPRAHTAESPEDAVRRFLEAEQAGDYDASFDFLSDADRAVFGSAGGWVASHADVVPPVEGFEVTATDGMTVVTTVRYTPSVDSIVGLVPGTARVTWAVAEGEAFGVDLQSSVSEPQLPPDDRAAPAVQAWAEERRACVDEPLGEWDGDLVGSPTLADPLCGSNGQITTGAPALLGPAEGAPFFAAFGDEVAQWARVVTVDGPVPLRAVVAPLGDDWVVVGVLATGPGAGL